MASSSGEVQIDALVSDLTTNPVYNAVAESIRHRRTIKQFLPQPVPRAVLQELLDLAVWAPNHRLTEPWRFYVLDGAARDKLGEIASAITVEKLVSSRVEMAAASRKGEEAAATWSAVPALLYVTTLRDENPEIDEENYGATCCAIQNFSLAAHAAGIGTSWSSGAVAAAPALHELVGAGVNEKMAGLIRVGYIDPALPSPKGRRKESSGFTVWVNDLAE